MGLRLPVGGGVANLVCVTGDEVGIDEVPSEGVGVHWVSRPGGTGKDFETSTEQKNSSTPRAAGWFWVSILPWVWKRLSDQVRLEETRTDPKRRRLGQQDEVRVHVQDRVGVMMMMTQIRHRVGVG